jgi:1-deoxy-D-xylulose-5-phosphate reductoisomerase
MKRLAIFGSTGSIGTNTLKIAEAYPEKYHIVGLVAGSNVKLLAHQIQKFKPRVVCLATQKAASSLLACLQDKRKIEVLWGQAGMEKVATMPEAELVVSAIAGSAGLLPTLNAIRSGKDIAIANKEPLVMAGELLIKEMVRSKGRIIPVDSEHSAIAQILDGRNLQEVRQIILTASGGPFLNYNKRQLLHVTPEKALKHPRWKMGKKVTIDSATLMNKGLEVIEAHWLFSIPSKNIKVIIHPQSIVHSMVEFIDGSMLAQLSQPDMKGPIAYALSYPERLKNTVKFLDIAKIKDLTFMEPDENKFPTLRLAYEALEAGNLMPTVLNAANEIAVQKFLEKKIRFPAIAGIIEKTMGAFHHHLEMNLDNVLWADSWARRQSENIIERMH